MTKAKSRSYDNNQRMAEIVSSFDVRQEEVLNRFNDGLPISLSIRAFKSYQAGRDVKTSAPCPDGVLARMEVVASGAPSNEIKNLVSLVARLARALKKEHPDNQLAMAATDYLKNNYKAAHSVLRK